MIELSSLVLSSNFQNKITEMNEEDCFLHIHNLTVDTLKDSSVLSSLLLPAQVITNEKMLAKLNEACLFIKEKTGCSIMVDPTISNSNNFTTVLFRADDQEITKLHISTKIVRLIYYIINNQTI